MRFDYTEEQRLVAESVRRFVQQDYSFEARRRIVASEEGWSRDVWATIADLGLLALPLPTIHGGFGGGAIDLLAVMQAFGDALVVEPFLSTLVAARLIERCGTERQQAALLPAIGEGRLVVVFADAEVGGVGVTPADSSVMPADSSLIPADSSVIPAKAGIQSHLTGTIRSVIHAPCADKLIVSARDGKNVRLFLVDRADATLHARVTLDNLRAANVELNASPAQSLGEGDASAAIEEVSDYATALLCAEAVGAMTYANEATLEYLKTRKQFGVPIGSFQALQHRMVDMVIECEQARSMASLACARVDARSDPVARARLVSAAKIKIADAARRISQESVQLHGGMGMSDELKVSHTFRRLTAIARELGDVDYHLDRFARSSVGRG